MKKFSAGNVGLVQGSRMLFSDFVNGGVMWTGEGDRECRHIVSFKEPFANAPSVQVSVGLWDTDQGRNLRADICAEHVTADGFHIVFRTWGDTRIARVRADWIAIGPVRDEDMWTID